MGCEQGQHTAAELSGQLHYGLPGGGCKASYITVYLGGGAGGVRLAGVREGEGSEGLKVV